MTEAMWRVFVSHSTKSDPGGIAARLRARLQEEFRRSAYEILVDEEFIAPGDHWKAELAEVIDRSEVGIVLLDKNALSSKYVRYEVDILCHKDQRRQILLIPILIGIERKQIREITDHVGLSHLLEDQDIDGENFDIVIAKITAKLAAIPGGMSLAELRIVREFARCLPDTPQDVIDVVIKLGEVRYSRNLPPFGSRELLAVQMLKSGLSRKLAEVFRECAGFFAEVRPERRLGFVTRLASSWIDPDEVGRGFPFRGEQRCTVVIGTGISEHAGVQYVRQATQWDYRCEVALHGDVPAGPEWAQHQADLEKTLDDRLGNRDEVGSTLTHYLVVPAGKSKEMTLEFVKTVHRLRPDIVVVLVVGAGTDRDDLVGDLGTNCVVVPDVDCVEEARATAVTLRICRPWKFNLAQVREATREALWAS